MEVSSTYSSPVNVNGFACYNCSEVALAEKNIDPADPSAGPFGVNDPAKAEKDYFAPEARDAELMQQRFEGAARNAVSPAASAYAANMDAGDRPLVNRLA